MTTMNVLDSDGDVVAVEKPLAPGRAAASTSRPVTIATEDFAAIGATTETAPITDTGASGLNGRLQRIAQRISSFIALIPAALTGSGNFKVAVQEALPAGTNDIGKTRTSLAAVSALTEVKIDFSSSGDQTIVAATSSQTTRLYRLLLVAGNATTITFKSATTALTGAITLADGGSIVLDLSGEPWLTTGANEALIINSSAAVQVSGRAYYVKS